MIKENIEGIRNRIAEVCARIKVDPDRITVICVTKGRPVAQIQEAISLGLKSIGENRVQEALEKYNQISGVKWHMVGHLQANKARDAVKIFDLIHSVDSVSLAGEINKQALKINKIQDVLLEVKTSSEVSKFGFKPELLAEACQKIIKFQNVKIKGLMTIAPVVDRVEKTRPYFRQLRESLDRINQQLPGRDQLKILSMGMSDDFQAAIEEGATLVRIGRAIFES